MSPRTKSGLLSHKRLERFCQIIDGAGSGEEVLPRVGMKWLPERRTTAEIFDETNDGICDQLDRYINIGELPRRLTQYRVIKMAEELAGCQFGYKGLQWLIVLRHLHHGNAKCAIRVTSFHPRCCSVAELASEDYSPLNRILAVCFEVGVPA